MDRRRIVPMGIGVVGTGIGVLGVLAGLSGPVRAEGAPRSLGELFGTGTRAPAAPSEPGAAPPATRSGPAERPAEAVPGPQAQGAPGSREALFGLPAATQAPATPEAPSVAAALAAAEPAGDAVKVSGFFHGTLAYTYADPEHWSLFQNLAQVSASGRLGEGVGWKAGVRGFVDPVYASSDFYPGEVRSNQKVDGWVWESYLDFATGPLEWRVGRQQIVWGEVIAFFFADVVSSFDQRQFILPDFELTRLPQWAARAEWFEGDFHAEAVWVPVMTYDEIGEPGADFYPFRPEPVAGFETVILGEETPGNGIGDSGYGLRGNYLQGGWDTSLFFWSAPDRFPVWQRSVDLGSQPTLAFRPIHERVHQYGGTVAKDLGPAVVKVEAVYTNGQLFETASLAEPDGLVRGDQLDWIGSLEFSFPDETRLNLQFGQTRVLDHEDGMLVDDVENAASVLVSTRAWHPKVEPELLWVTSLDRTDWNLQARVTWELMPDWSVVGGVDLFNGEQQGFFGRFDVQDRVYGELWYRF